jgi:Spy/CpxP family protein refolding chaperone
VGGQEEGMARFRSVLAVVAGVGIALGMCAGVMAPRAEAQMRFGMGRGMGFGGSRISQGDVDRYVKILQLDKKQQDALKDLFAAYDTDYEAAEKVMQEKLDKIQADFQDTQDFSVWQKDWPEVQEKYQTRTADLEKSFVGDVKTLLTADQSSRWPAAERANRRAKSLGGGLAGVPGMGLAGESVDLVKMVEDMHLAKTPEPVTQVMDRYESEMDAALVAREKKQKELGEAMQNMQKDRMKDGGGIMPDMSKIQEMMTGMRKAGVPVRDINDRYSSLLESALPDAQRSDFSDKYKKAKFPNIYKEAYAFKALNAANDFKDLTDEQKTGIAEIRTSYTKDIGGANERYARAQADAEKDGGGDDMMSGWMRMMNGGGDGKDESELSLARKARRKLDSDALEKLKAILTPEQKDRLPERENDMFQSGGPRRR